MNSQVGDNKKGRSRSYQQQRKLKAQQKQQLDQKELPSYKSEKQNKTNNIDEGNKKTSNRNVDEKPLKGTSNLLNNSNPNSTKNTNLIRTKDLVRQPQQTYVPAGKRQMQVRKPLFTLTVELERTQPSKTASVLVYENDDSRLIGKRFGVQHKLGTDKTAALCLLLEKEMRVRQKTNT
eukprot:Pgem_evm2s1281